MAKFPRLVLAILEMVSGMLCLSLKLCPDITPEDVSHSSISLSMNTVPLDAVLLPQFSPPSQWVGRGTGQGGRR